MRFRVDGILREVLEPKRELAALLVSRIKVMARLDIAEKRVPQDGRISLRVGGREVDVRVSTLPSAGVGALLALQLLDTEFSLISLLGLFLLIGIVKKNAILMIDLALQLERGERLSPQESIRRACLLRFRPIMMTTLAALLGALPLLLSRAEGAEMRQPLGITIVGGLILSQLLTLYTTPVVYLYLDRLRHRVNRWRGVRSDAALETPL